MACSGAIQQRAEIPACAGITVSEQVYSCLLTGGTFADDVDSPSSPIKLDFAIYEGKKGKVATDSDPVTGMELRPDLPNDDISCSNGLAAVLFDSSSLPIGIPTITAGPLPFFMRHCSRTARITLALPYSIPVFCFVKYGYTAK